MVLKMASSHGTGWPVTIWKNFPDIRFPVKEKKRKEKKKPAKDALVGATIVPFGTVGEDDIQELILDYNDLVKIPVVNDYVRETVGRAAPVRDGSKGDLPAKKCLCQWLAKDTWPLLFSVWEAHMETKGMEEVLQDEGKANELYFLIKFEVERNIAYLLAKRKEDPYRNIIDRTIYPLHEVPAFQYP